MLMRAVSRPRVALRHWRRIRSRTFYWDNRRQLATLGLMFGVTVLATVAGRQITPPNPLVQFWAAVGCLAIMLGLMWGWGFMSQRDLMSTRRLRVIQDLVRVVELVEVTRCERGCVASQQRLLNAISRAAATFSTSLPWMGRRRRLHSAEARRHSLEAAGCCGRWPIGSRRSGPEICRGSGICTCAPRFSLRAGAGRRSPGWNPLRSSPASGIGHALCPQCRGRAFSLPPRVL